MPIAIGVLALQGDFAKHGEALRRIGIKAIPIRKPSQLDECKGLILPGGESTTFFLMLDQTGLSEAIQSFARENPLMGTCAGLITLSRKIVNDTKAGLNLIDVEVERNGYGRQIDSFVRMIRVSVFDGKQEFEGIFIRAPRIRSWGPDVIVLASFDGETVMVRNRNVLGMTFHPELTQDIRIHRYFVEQFIKTGSGVGR